MVNHITTLTQYLSSTTPPLIAEAALRRADTRILESASLLCHIPQIRERLPGAQTERRIALAHATWQNPVGNCHGGLGIGGCLRTGGARFVASILACWPTLQRISPLFAGFDLRNTSLPSLDAFHTAYADIRCTSIQNTALAKKFKAITYKTLRGGFLNKPLPHRIPLTLQPIDAIVGGYASATKPPSTGTLVRTTQAAAWFEQFREARKIDVEYPSDRTDNREAKRHTSISQYGTEGWLLNPTDTPTKFPSAAFEVAIARRSGLPLHALLPLVADGINNGTTNYNACLGDNECNTAEHNTRHHATNRAIHDMKKSTAAHAVVLGDKTQEQKYKLVNKGRCYDIGELKAGPRETDILTDTKVASPFTTLKATGQGTQGGGGTIASVGNEFSFGSTEEKLRVDMLGCKQRGSPSDPLFCHSKGTGHVMARDGDYADALSRGARVGIGLVEVLGGICPELRADIYKHQVLANKTGVDYTNYSRHPRAPKKGALARHHMIRIVYAAVRNDCDLILAKINLNYYNAATPDKDYRTEVPDAMPTVAPVC